MAKRRRRGRTGSGGGALTIVQQARTAAKRALDSLREEIRATATRLEKLVSEERRFREELFGAVRGGLQAAVGRVRRGPGRPRQAAGGAAKPRASRARKGPPKAERFFGKLPSTFTLEDVRKVAGAKAGISLAQWSRAKRIRKTGKGYQKVEAA